MIELKEKYQKEMMPALKKEFGYKSTMEIPTIEKIVLNTCVSEAVKNPKVLNNVVEDLTTITGQRAVQTKAKKAISNFKLREGMPLGATVTLRRDKMWAFLERLVHISLPRVRDFRGISAKAFDGRGNYNMGLKEQIVFPEINYDKVDTIRGMNITICTTAKTDAEGRALLEQIGMPFRKK